MSGFPTQSGTGRVGRRRRAWALVAVWRCPNSYMRSFRKTFVLLVSIGSCGVSLVESFHYFKYQHFTPLGLHADLFVHRRDVGFEGISKLYSVKLTNYGFLPATVSACDFIEVTGQRGTAIAYAVEKWNTQSTKWEPVGDWDQSSFCRPHP
jgi:hypothetical protein